jgi:hypothetical protein
MPDWTYRQTIKEPWTAGLERFNQMTQNTMQNIFQTLLAVRQIKAQDEQRKQQETMQKLQMTQTGFKLMSDPDVPDEMKPGIYNMVKQTGLFGNMPEVQNWESHYTKTAKRAGNVMQKVLNKEYDWPTAQSIFAGLMSEARTEGERKQIEPLMAAAKDITSRRATEEAAGQMKPEGQEPDYTKILSTLPKDSPLVPVLQNKIKEQQKRLPAAEQAFEEEKQGGKTALEALKTVKGAEKTEPAIEDDRKYQDIYKRQLLGQPVSMEEKAYAKSYEKRKTLGPMASAAVRFEGLKEIYADIKQQPVYDTQTGTMSFASANDIKQNPGRFAPAGPEAKAMDKQNLLQDIKGQVGRTRQAVQGLKRDFDVHQRAQIALVLESRDPASAISNFMGSTFAKSLTDDQQTYVVRLLQLKEQAMAMRSVLGAGQGSDMMRRAVEATIPGMLNPSKGFAMKQLNEFESTLNRLQRYVPKVKPVPGTDQPAENDPIEGLKEYARKGDKKAQSYLKGQGIQWQQ